MEPGVNKSATIPTMPMWQPRQLIATTEILPVEYLSRALQEAAHRKEVAIRRYTQAEAEVRRLEEVCKGLKKDADFWENVYNSMVKAKTTDVEVAYSRCEKRNQVLEERVKLLYQLLYAKHVKPPGLPVTVQQIHIEILQNEVHDLLDKQETMEKEVRLTTETLQNVMAAVLALVAEVENSQPWRADDGDVKNKNVGSKRQRPVEVSSSEDLISNSSNPLEHTKEACYESIRSAQTALVDATANWKTMHINLI